MPITDRTPTLFFATFLFFAMTAISHAQQWNGPANPNGTIWRPGNVAVGEQVRGDDPRAMLEVTRPLAMAGESDDRLFSANMHYKGDMSPRFEVDTRRAYAGGARSKAGILAADLDFAVHRKAPSAWSTSQSAPPAIICWSWAARFWPRRSESN